MKNSNLRTPLTGVVFNIQRYAVNDGPGIRTTVFLKGCPLRCRWCQNPESFHMQPEIGFRNGTAFTIGEHYTVDELLEKVKRDIPFYEESGGGITLSGGEPVTQFDFALAFLKACKEAGLNTAIETNGFMPREKYAELWPFLDHIYFDLKLIKSSDHKQWTGADNANILENARWLVKSGAPIVFRVPLVNGMTATESNINAIGAFLKELDVTKVELCPYQDGWEKKLAWLAAPPLPLNMPTMSAEEINRVVDLFSKSGITADNQE